MVTSEAPLQEAASYLTGKNSIRALLRCRHTASYPRPPDHGHVQCVEVGRERKKGRVQRRLSSAWGLGRNVPGPAGSREDEAPSGGEGTERFRGPVRWVARSPDPGGLGGVPHPRRGAPSARAENAAGRWQRRARWPAEGAPAPPGERGAPHTTCARAPRLREEGRESEAGRIPSQLSLHRRRPIIRRR